jgi:Protein of unknown function DUF262/Protein of unknown function (DUF1524)
MRRMQFFTTTHSSLDEAFGADKTYTIPAYQRPYSWQSLGKTDQNNQVNRMWDDLWEFFSENDKDKEYFLGSMVVIQKEARAFEVVDGQQRLTTLALLFAAMSCFVKEYCQAPELAKFRESAVSRLEKLLYNYSGVTLVQQLKVKILRAAGYDYNEVLSGAVSCAPASGVKDPRYAEIAERYFQNRDYFSARLRESFLTGGVFTVPDAERFDAFFTFLNVRVAIVLITTASFETSFMIFETLNNRGLPLTNLDLLRNFLFEELTQAKAEDPAALWTAIEQGGLTEDFMARWVESWSAQQQRSSAFSDLRNLYDRDPAFQNLPGQPKALRFYETLRRDLAYFGLIADPRAQVSDPTIQRKIRFLRVAGNQRYSFNLMLALFRRLDYHGESSQAVVDFLCAYQRWVLHVLLSHGERFSSAGIYRAIGLIRAGRVEDAKATFALDAKASALLERDIAGDLHDNATAKLVLAEYVWHEEATSHDVVTQELRWDEASLEHVIPQAPDAKSQWVKDFSKDFREKYTYRLGNMTLLTVKMNATASNSDLAKKQEQYQKTLLPLTKELAALPTLTEAYIQERHERIVAGVLRGLRLR